MKVGKVIKIGDSFGIVIPKQYMRQLGWMIGDHLSQEISDGELRVNNVNRRSITLTHTRAEYGDGFDGRPQQSIRVPRDPAGPDR